MSYKLFSFSLLGIILGAFVVGTVQYVLAWTGPTATPPNGNVTARSYLADCTNFTTGGWANKDECLQDGRWHKVLTHGVWGAPASADLIAAHKGGADIKFMSDGNNIYVPAYGVWIPYAITQRECGSTILEGGHLLCLGDAGYSGVTDDATLRTTSATTKKIGVGVMKTNGIVTCVESYGNWEGDLLRTSTGSCGPYVQVGGSWWIRY